MRGQGIDYFENSRRATYAHRAYAIANPMAWTGYSSQIWGLTASDGPANATVVLNGRFAPVPHLLGTRGLAVRVERRRHHRPHRRRRRGGVRGPRSPSPRCSPCARRTARICFRPTASATRSTRPSPPPASRWSAAPWTPRSAGSTSTTWASDQGPIIAMIEKLPDGTDLAADARQHAYRPGTVPGGVQRGVDRGQVSAVKMRAATSRE